MNQIIKTVRKFHDFSITQISREINFWDSGSAKSAILTQLEALNFDLYEFLHFLNVDIYQKNPQNSKHLIWQSMAVL